MTNTSSYRIGRLLGQGGFGAVYLADDLILEKQCAVKESLENSPAAQAQFEVEARILANLNQPHLPRVTDNFIEPATGLQYLVMEYVEGQNLGDLLAQSGPLPEDKVRDWADQVNLLNRDAGARATFLMEGSRAPRVGEWFRK